MLDANIRQKCATFWTKPANIICLFATFFIVSMFMLIQGYLCPSSTDFCLNLYCPFKRDCGSCSRGESCDSCAYKACQIRDGAPASCNKRTCENASNLLQCSEQIVANSDG